MRCKNCGYPIYQGKNDLNASSYQDWNHVTRDVVFCVNTKLEGTDLINPSLVAEPLIEVEDLIDLYYAANQRSKETSRTGDKSSPLPGKV